MFDVTVFYGHHVLGCTPETVLGKTFADQWSEIFLQLNGLTDPEEQLLKE